MAAACHLLQTAPVMRRAFLPVDEKLKLVTWHLMLNRVLRRDILKFTTSLA